MFNVKRGLANSMQELMQKKSIQDITVTELIEYAEISRSTFIIKWKLMR